jgi:2-oxoglutarate/2-oxoacid ferredoxin oxidoreductase subunit beta
MVTTADYPAFQTAWCPGCGNFGILNAVRKALVELQLEPQQVLMVSGIGQAAKLPHYTRANIFNSLHGRPMPPALGAKMANGELVVLVISGDGDAYGEGGNHFIHAMRRNHNVTYLVHDNQVYGLTKGQASPTSDPGYVSKTTPFGAVTPVNPLTLAIAAGATFVARGFAGDIEHLAGVIKAGINHCGFALIDILQPCVTFNHKNTYEWFRQRVYKLDGAGYDPTDRGTAFARAQEWGDKIPIGIIYKREGAPAFEDSLPVLRRGPLVKQRIEPLQAEKLLEEFV